MIDELTKLKQSYIDGSCANIPDDLADLRAEVAEFIKYPDAVQWEVSWQKENGPFLQTIGLPHSAPSMIDFQAAVEADGEFIYIGSNNYGDRIAVVKATGNVVYIDHDSDNRAEYMNRDPVSLFRSICAFAEVVAGQRCFPEKIWAFDREAIHKDRWWHQAYIGWTSSRE